MGYVNWEAGEFFCDTCAGDDDVIIDVEDQEADSPQHCSGCGLPFDNPLTEAGITYVMGKLSEALVSYRKRGTHVMPKQGTAEEAKYYWIGSRHIDITRHWAEELLNYNLADVELGYIESFLEETEA